MGRPVAGDRCGVTHEAFDSRLHDYRGEHDVHPSREVKRSLLSDTGRTEALVQLMYSADYRKGHPDPYNTLGTKR